MKHLVPALVVCGDDFCPGHLVASQLLVRRGHNQIPAEDGRHVAALHLKGRCEVGRLRQDFLNGRLCGRKESCEILLGCLRPT